VNTISEPVVVGRRRRKHSDEFKAQVVAACSQPGVSIAAVSMAHGVNANLARRWIIDAREPDGEPVEMHRGVVEAATPKLPLPPPFVPLSMPPASTGQEIHVELRRGTMSITATWPVAAASECAAWMRELLR
jgi:transposase-like protein